MPDQPSKASQAATGFDTLRKLAADSAEKNKKTAPKKAAPPDGDTCSFGGLLKSLKDRASYAIWGPSEDKDK